MSKEDEIRKYREELEKDISLGYRLYKQRSKFIHAFILITILCLLLFIPIVLVAKDGVMRVKVDENFSLLVTSDTYPDLSDQNLSVFQYNYIDLYFSPEQGFLKDWVQENVFYQIAWNRTTPDTIFYENCSFFWKIRLDLRDTPKAEFLGKIFEFKFPRNTFLLAIMISVEYGNPFEGKLETKIFQRYFGMPEFKDVPQFDYMTCEVNLIGAIYENQTLSSPFFPFLKWQSPTARILTNTTYQFNTRDFFSNWHN